MIISDSSISLGTEHFKQEKHTKEEKLTIWQSGRDPIITASDGSNKAKSINVMSFIAQQETEIVKLSSESVGRSKRISTIVDPVSENDQLSADLNIRILKAFIERLTGKKISLKEAGDIYPDQKKHASEKISDDQNVHPENRATGGTNDGYGLVYEYHESYIEQEHMSFNAQGVITTADGTEIAIDLSLTMSRSFVEENHLTIRAGEALKDPLVINYDGAVTDISGHEFNFDIDSDGTEDQLHFVGSGSGF